MSAIALVKGICLGHCHVCSSFFTVIVSGLVHLFIKKGEVNEILYAEKEAEMIVIG